MKLPDDFSFSQSIIQDYMDCEYRFYLRHIRKIEWPAVESEPVLLNQERMRIGQVFHRLVQQYFSGIDPALLEESIDDHQMTTWWNNFMNLDLVGQEGIKDAEKTLSIPFAGFRLSAKYDLILIEHHGNITIYDWKTSLVLPKPSILRNRAQSRVYPLILNELHSTPKNINQISTPVIKMIYWFPEFPDDAISFEYNGQQLSEDREFLLSLIKEITGKDEQQFFQVDDEKRCVYCRYRSLCVRGVTAGNTTELDQEIFEEDIFGISID